MFDPAEIALATLSSFIGEKLKDLTIIDEWPYGNEALKYPSATFTIGTPKRTPQISWVEWTSKPDENGLVKENEVVAQYEMNIQIDLWCQDKLQRREYVELITKLFNSQDGGIHTKGNSDGLSLKMKEMYDQIARYEIDTIEPMDDEAAAQRQERREKIVVLTNFFEIRQKTYYAIRKTVLKTQVATAIGGNAGIEADIDI